jgi:hypothetical protein
MIHPADTQAEPVACEAMARWLQANPGVHPDTIHMVATPNLVQFSWDNRGYQHFAFYERTTGEFHVWMEVLPGLPGATRIDEGDFVPVDTEEARATAFAAIRAYGRHARGRHARARRHRPVA